MNKIIKLFFLASIFCSTILAVTSTLTPENTEIIFDIDETIIEKMGYGIYQTEVLLNGIWQDPLNTITYINALFHLKNHGYQTDEYCNQRVYDRKGKKINGLTFQFLYHGICNPSLTPYIATIVEAIEYYRWFIPGTLKIITYLKDKKGYTINFATNKDQVSYELTAQAFGNKLTGLATKVFVAQPGNDDIFLKQIKEFADLPTTPVSYKELAHKALTAQPTNTIFHAPSRKPELQYYQYVAKKIGTHKNQIFVDDQQSNVDGFNKLQESTTALRYGICFKNPIQLADDLIKLGILSATDDTKLLDEIGYSRIYNWRSYYKKIATT